MADDDNVLTLPVGDARRAHNLRESEMAQLPIGRESRYRLDACKHERAIVDARARTVTCSSCGVPLDPIDRLDKIAYEWAEPLRRVQEARRRLAELEREIAELERVERNARARVRTARRGALTFDLPAIDAMLRVRFSQRSWGVRDYDALSEKEKDHARSTYAELIETYVAVLTQEES